MNDSQLSAINTTKTNEPLLFVLQRGDTIHEKIITICQEKNWNSAIIMNGIGAIEDPELGYYQLATKTYQKKHFSGDFEVITFTGNISISNHKVFPHIHCSISDTNCNVYGGHFFNATVALTLELFIMPVSYSIIRQFDETTGLNLIQH
ncbi:hypothetical protein DID76_02455 [Candidatus Marinamargulisbacteria bacterium SCGC AG-414-C22]|nr:hypothetical protein DID76_02455 [Candidatus Marinamargulisbacteria bacterium SCGC AG-414-C22]